MCICFSNDMGTGPSFTIVSALHSFSLVLHGWRHKLRSSLNSLSCQNSAFTRVSHFHHCWSELIKILQSFAYCILSHCRQKPDVSGFGDQWKKGLSLKLAQTLGSPSAATSPSFPFTTSLCLHFWFLSLFPSPSLTRMRQTQGGCWQSTAAVGWG